MSRLRRLLLRVAETDRTFERQEVRGHDVWVGRCIHCRGRVLVPVDPRERGSATLEHILPRTHGGTDALDNLALACAGCNHGKGARLDRRRLDDPTLQRVIARLRDERRARLRPSPHVD